MIAVATSSFGNSVFSKIIFPNSGSNMVSNVYATINMMVHGCFSKNSDTLVVLFGNSGTSEIMLGTVDYINT